MKVSIITTCYNREETIREAIESVLAQTYPDIEYIIVDGASKDNSLKIIREYEDQITKIISEPDRGMYEAINKGIKAATGDIIGLMHSDDVFYSNDVIRHYVERFQISDADLVYGNGIYVDYKNTEHVYRIWNSGNYARWKVKTGWLPLHPTVYITREKLLENGLYDESYMIASDSDFLVRYLYDCTLKVSYLNETVVRMRLGGLSTATKWASKKWSEDLRMYKSHGFSPYLSLAGKISSKIPQFLKAKFSHKKSLEIVKNEPLYNLDTLFALLRVACGQYTRLPSPLTDEQWENLFVSAGKQSVAGLCATGIEKLPQYQKPPTQVRLNWVSYAYMIEAANKDLLEKSVRLQNRFRQKGIRSCQLKGNAVSVYYPNPNLRQSGDIDLWCSPIPSIPDFMNTHKGAEDLWVTETRNEMVKMIDKYATYGEVHYHHADMNIFHDTSVEIHFTPSYMMNPFTNARLQHWFGEKSEIMLNNPDPHDIEVIKFNLVYVLVHFYKHVLGEGIGVRHVMDYFYILKAFYESYDDDGKREESRKEILKEIDGLGMMKILRGLTWMLKEKAGLPSIWALCEGDSKEGNRLLRGIVIGGNFGHYNPKNLKQVARKGNHISRLLHGWLENPYYFRYPKEALFNPYWSIRLYFLIHKFKK